MRPPTNGNTASVGLVFQSGVFPRMQVSCARNGSARATRCKAVGAYPRSPPRLLDTPNSALLTCAPTMTIAARRPPHSPAARDAPLRIKSGAAAVLLCACGLAQAQKQGDAGPPAGMVTGAYGQSL